MRLVYQVIKQHYPTLTYDDDIVQAGMLGLCKAAEKWDEKRGKFSSFAWKCIRNTISLELRYRNKHKGILSLDYEYDDDEDGTTTLQDTIVGDKDIAFSEFSDFAETLKPNQLKIIDLRQRGLSIEEVAKQLGCSRQNVWGCLRLVKRQWERYLDQKD